VGVVAGLAAALISLGGCELNHSDDNLVAGKQLFVAKCGSCHVLGRAGTKGNVGPNLDAAFARDLREGFTRETVRGVVHAQIQAPGRGTAMPANLVRGQQASDIAAYVAAVVGRPGQDTGLLASAVAPAGAGKPAVASGGTLEIDADPNGQLAYVTNKANAPPGSITIKMKNGSSTPHNIALEGNGANGAGAIVQGGGVSSVQTTLRPGTYTYFCQVQGHREAGMLGTLTVK